jgi:hypothetical protein
MTRNKYTAEVLADAAANSSSIAGVLRYLGIKWSGGSHHHISKQLRRLGVDTSHFTGGAHNKGQIGWWAKRTPEEILIARPDGERRTGRQQLYRAMLATGVPELCALCGIGPTWERKRLTLHIDHINGDFLDNRPENVRFLCPNCHSQTPTFANRRRDGPTACGVTSVVGAMTSVEIPGARGPYKTPAWNKGPWIQPKLE